MKKTKIKELLPIPFLLHKIQKYRLKNRDITILSSNCLGGVIYHCLGLKFLSPTVNLRVNSTREFLKFCLNINYYLSQEITEVNDEETPYPLGMCGDIKLHFNHYHSFDEAVAKWESRKKRINWDNIYVIAHDYISDTETITKKEILEFGKVKCKNLILFTRKPYDDIPYVFNLKSLNAQKRMMITNKFTGLRDFEKYWDYVKFLNSERTTSSISMARTMDNARELK